MVSNPIIPCLGRENNIKEEEEKKNRSKRKRRKEEKKNPSRRKGRNKFTNFDILTCSRLILH